MKSNIEQLKIAQKYLGDRCNKCCGMSSNCCCKYVCKIFRESGNASLFYDGKTVVYCPTAIKWCMANLAEIPLYLALPSDVIFFDWNGNGDPDHIGFVRSRVTTTEIATLEGNTTGGKVGYKTRTAKYIQGIFRPHFKATFDLSKPLEIDGKFGYNSIAYLQSVLKKFGFYKAEIDGILGKGTVKALQKMVGVTQDGAWGVKTSKAIQKILGVNVDGYFGEDSTKALQKYLNQKMAVSTKPTTPTKPKPTAPTQKPTVTEANGKLVVDGIGGTATVKAMQRFFGTKQDGVIGGQKKDLSKYYSSLEAVRFGNGGSACVKKMQAWIGVTADGVWGENTSKALQKKLGVTVDGKFGKKSMEAWQKYLNSHDTLSNTQKLVDTARSLAWAKGTAKAKYAWKGGSATSAFKSALAKAYPNRSKWSKAPKAGCCCDVFVGTVVRASGLDSKFPRGWDEQIKHKSDNFVKLTYTNVSPYSVSKDGDIILYTKNKSGTSKHVLMRGDDVIYEAQYESTYGHVNTAVKKKLDVKRPKVVIFRAK